MIDFITCSTDVYFLGVIMTLLVTIPLLSYMLWIESAETQQDLLSACIIGGFFGVIVSLLWVVTVPAAAISMVCYSVGSYLRNRKRGPHGS